MPSKFIHLHCHSEYSLLEGAMRIQALLDRCQEQKMSAVALTDNAMMYGTIEFYTKAKAMGIKPIIGCELYLTPNMQVKERGWDRLVVLCQNWQGYQNLIQLVTRSHLDGFYYKPRIDLDCLSQFTEGLIAISPGFKGPIAYRIRNNHLAQAEEQAVRLKTLFKNNFYIGLQKTGAQDDDTLYKFSLSLAKSLAIPVVATNDVYYLNQEDAYLKDVLLCIQTGRKLNEETRLSDDSGMLYLKNADEMIALFQDCPEAIENTKKIAGQCQLEIETEQVILPRFDCPDGKTAIEYLKALVQTGLKTKYTEITPEIQNRTNFELSIIEKMGYPRYFLIIYDFLEFAREQNIPIGPGRGSAAGSIVAYALDITKIDPLRYKLLFERFLNPERISMPDIDLDFCIRRRNEVIQYLIKKYGADHVSQIVTFGSMAARGVVRDVGRVLDVPLNEVDHIAKLIPSNPGAYTSIPEAIEQVPELKKLYSSSPDNKKLLDIGSKLEGFSRHTSTHAAGVVISRDPLATMVPLMRNEGQVVTQYQMTDLEKIGLLKMDILGLRNLTVMQDALSLIKDNHHITLNLDTLPVDDKKTYDLLCSGETIGIFQLESRGMRGLIKDLQPRVFEDLIALLALYRPGPLGSGMVQNFISNKSGKTKVKYELAELEPILKETYGMIVYQEQVMQIASTIGGFSLGEADMLRRAMGKKQKAVMDKMRAQFMKGAKDKGFPDQPSKKIFELCYKFAEYGFNKSHSAAYALISFQTAYLKAHYPIEYMAALLSSVVHFMDKITVYIEEAKRMGIFILPPCVNESKIDFTIIADPQLKKRSIRFGLGAIKNVGEAAIESIIKNRHASPYKNMLDFCLRVDLRQVNKRVIESAIKSGAADALGDRSELLTMHERILETAQLTQKERLSGQVQLFASLDASQITLEMPHESKYNELTYQEKLSMEKEILGLYVSGHPLDEVRDKLERMAHTTQKLTVEMNDQPVRLLGLITNSRRLLTRQKREMMIGELEDLYGRVSILIFQQEQFERLAKIFQDNNIVYISGRVRVNQSEISVIADNIELIDRAHNNRNLYIDIENINDLSIFKELQSLSQLYKGSMPVYFKSKDTTILTHKKFWLADNELCLKQVETLLGAGHFWIS